MNLDKLMVWVIGIVMLFAGTGNLDVLQKWVSKTQAEVIYNSRSSTWGSPRFFPASHIAKQLLNTGEICCQMIFTLRSEQLT